MNTGNTLPDSYQERVYNNTHATEKREIQQAENQTPALVIRIESLHVGNAIFLGDLASEVELREPEIKSTDPHSPMTNICMDDEHYSGMQRGSRDFEDEDDKSDNSGTIPSTSQPWGPGTELERIAMGSSNVYWHEDEDGYNADPDEEEDVSPAYDGSM